MKLKANYYAVLFITALLLISCSSDDGGQTQTIPEITATVSFSVTTEVTGKPATITYTDAGSSDKTLNNQTLPWNVTYTGNFNPGETIVLKAVSTVPGAMTATLSINGTVVATATNEDEINLSGVVN
jgi:hypothetical protein